MTDSTWDYYRGLSEAEQRRWCEVCEQCRDSGLPFPDDMPTALLEVSVRTANMLSCERFVTVGQVRHATDRDLLRLPNFWKRSLSELRQLIPFSDTPVRAIGVCARCHGQGELGRRAVGCGWWLLDVTNERTGDGAVEMPLCPSCAEAFRQFMADGVAS